MAIVPKAVGKNLDCEGSKVGVCQSIESEGLGVTSP